MDILYIASSGPADPTKASIPVHLAVNGSFEVGHTTSLLLAGDGSGLLKADVRDGLEGVGLPPGRELFAKIVQHAIPVYV